jgi:hypothetical protein
MKNSVSTDINRHFSFWGRTEQSITIAFDAAKNMSAFWGDRLSTKQNGYPGIEILGIKNQEFLGGVNLT